MIAHDFDVSISAVGDDATVTTRYGDQFDIPTACVRLEGGRAWIEVPPQIVADFKAERVALVAIHPEPTAAHIGAAIASLNPDIVTALMTQELEFSSLEDPIGLAAMRAVARAANGELPQHGQGDLGGLV